MTPDSSQRVTVVGALLAAVALVVAAPGPARLLDALTDPAAAATATVPVVALLTLVAWALAAYLLVVAALTVGSRLPGAAGRVLAAAAHRTAPAGLRRALGLALGATLVVGPTAGPAAASTHGSVAASGASPVVAAAVPSLDHPAGAPAPSPSSTSAALDRAAAPPSLDHPTGPAAPAPADPGLPTAGDAQVVVQPGDSLWSIAEERLGPRATDAQVAQAWPSWWQANRERVGDDPDLLLPGTPLRPPARPPA